MQRATHRAHAACQETGEKHRFGRDSLGRLSQRDNRNSERFDDDDWNREKAFKPIILMTIMSQWELGAYPRLITAKNAIATNGITTIIDEVRRSPQGRPALWIDRRHADGD
jgi:hypothetical protein